MSGESVYFHALISAVSAIRFINNNAASTTPISIATTRSKNTVKKKVATRTMMSLFGAVLQKAVRKKSSPPYLRQPQEEQRLKWSLGSMQQAASKPEEWSLRWYSAQYRQLEYDHRYGHWQQFLRLRQWQEYRRKSPEKNISSPCPISSALDLCVSPIIPSDTTAESRDSIPARMAIVNAGEIISCTSFMEKSRCMEGWKCGI